MIIHFGYFFCIYFSVSQAFDFSNSELQFAGSEPDARITINSNGENPEDCDENGPKARSVIAQKPQVRLVHRKREESKEEVKRRHLGPKHCGTETKELAPKKSLKVETYTETYTVTQIKHRTLTRKHRFIQRRRLIKQKINKPILVVKRKVVKERQTYERIVPKVIETRQVLNNPEYITQYVTGPVEEVTEEGMNEAMDVTEGDVSVIGGDALILESDGHSQQVYEGNHEAIVVDSADSNIVVDDGAQHGAHISISGGDAIGGQQYVVQDSGISSDYSYGGGQRVVVQESGNSLLSSSGGARIVVNEAVANQIAEEPVHIRVNENPQSQYVESAYRQNIVQPSYAYAQQGYAQPVYASYGKKK